MELNTIYSDKEYQQQGFTVAECPMIRRHDELFNQYIKAGRYLKPRKEAEMFELARRLGL